MPVPRSVAHAASALAVTTAVLGVAAPGGAWTGSERISPPRTFVDRLQLANARDGTAVAGWTFQRGRGSGSATGVEMTARRGSRWGPVRTIAGATTPRGVALTGLESYGRTRLIALTQHDSARIDRLEARFGRAGRSMGRPHRLAAADLISSARLAVEPSGTAVAVWTQGPARGGSRAHVAARAPGGGFGSDEPLSQPGAGSTAIALSGRFAFAAWLRAGRIEGRMSRDGGRSWGGTQRLGRAVGRRADISIAVSRRGAVAVGWTHQALTEGGEHGPAIAEARLRAPGGGFGAVVRLERHEARAPEPGVGVETGFADERAVVAWQGRSGARDSEPDGARFAVRAAELTHDDLTGLTTLTPPADSAVLEDLAIRGGRAAVSWRVPDGDDVTGGLYASVAEGGAWGPPELLASRGRASRLAWSGGGLDAAWIAPAGAGEAVHAATR